MNKLGIETISCNIQKIEDEKGFIVALGQNNMSQIQKDASIAKAQAERDVAIAAAELAKRQRDAEAKFYEQQQEAKAKRELADADRYAMEQKAEGIKAQGEAEAKAIEAKGIAEAQAMEKKAKAMQKYGQAAMLQMIVEKLPEMAQAVAEPLGSIDKVTIIDGGNSGNGESGVSSMGGYVPDVLAKTIESVKETTGLDITEIMKANTYDAKVNKNLNVTGLPEDININKKAGSET